MGGRGLTALCAAAIDVIRTPCARGARIMVHSFRTSRRRSNHRRLSRSAHKSSWMSGITSEHRRVFLEASTSPEEMSETNYGYFPLLRRHVNREAARLTCLRSMRKASVNDLRPRGREAVAPRGYADCACV